MARIVPMTSDRFDAMDRIDALQRLRNADRSDLLLPLDFLHLGRGQGRFVLCAFERLAARELRVPQLLLPLQ